MGRVQGGHTFDMIGKHKNGKKYRHTKGEKKKQAEHKYTEISNTCVFVSRVGRRSKQERFYLFFVHLFIRFVYVCSFPLGVLENESYTDETCISKAASVVPF